MFNVTDGRDYYKCKKKKKKKKKKKTRFISENSMSIVVLNVGTTVIIIIRVVGAGSHRCIWSDGRKSTGSRGER